jgi:hypothetical protein
MPLPAITHENITAPSLNTNTNLSHPFDISNIYSSVTNNQFHPIFLNQPETDNTNPQSLTSQILSFSSQPLTRAPQSIKPANHKSSRASTHKSVITRPTSHTNPDPILTRIGPEKEQKKPKPNPTLTQPNPVSTLVTPEDMVTQVEKKRRRENDSVEAEKLKEAESFLTAGPGSQACRDQ